MNIYQTDLQKAEAKQPTELDFYQAADRRHLLRTDEETYKLRRLIAGEAGEKIVADYLNQYGKKQWIGIRNLWMNYFGPFECDYILITRYKIYVFEIKNYKGELVYENGTTTMDGVERNINPIHQAIRNRKNIQEMINQVFPKIPVVGVLVFSGVDNYIRIQSEVKELEIIPRNALYSFIKKIKKEEQNLKGKTLDAQQILSVFEEYEIHNIFVPEPVTKIELARAKKGIYCTNCNSYQVQVKKFTVNCKCGHIEKREEAVLRTICDYGILNFTSELTRQELLNFFDYQISKNYLLKVLNKYFPVVRKNSRTYYKNQTMFYV